MNCVCQDGGTVGQQSAHNFNQREPDVERKCPTNPVLAIMRTVMMGM